REFRTGIPLVQQTSARSADIIRNAVVVRRGASTKTGRIATVDRGKTARILGKVGDWYKLKFASGTVGFVRRDCLSTEPLMASNPRNWRNATRSDYYAAIDGDSTDLIAEAKRHLGTRYVWGGTTTRGFDCSGFVRYVYGKAEGITLPRTSREQARFGVRVPKAELRPGDVLSFASRGGSRINHSGIYIGNGNFIHASSGGGRVRIDALQGYYAKRLISAHRPTAKLRARNVEDAITAPTASANGAKTD
ncbi:MAG: C40 family peptidase, partial [Fimbriimonadales bacterium]